MVLITGLSAQESTRNDMQENQITAISISGLKRTKPYIVERLLQKFIGRNAADVDINEVIAVIESTGILEPVSVELIDNQDGSGITLLVTIL
jgi:outer membrane protein assembly factor BamA